MTTHHPNSKNGKSPSTPDDYADVTNHFTESALDIQTMHTRLADLLDQVSVSGPLADDESAADSQEKDSSPQNGFSDLHHDGPDQNHISMNDATSESTAAKASAQSDGETILESNFDGVTSGGSSSKELLFEESTFESSDAFQQPRAEISTPPVVLSDEQRFDDIRRSEMSDEGMSDIRISDESNQLGGAIDNRGSSADNSAITIKGRTDGISIEIGVGSWRMLMAQLRQRLHQSSGFFRGGIVSLDVGSRVLTQEDLANAQEVLDEHGLTLGMVRTLSQETSQAVSTLGVSVTLDQPTAAVSQPTVTNHESLAHFVYRGNLRSGQVLRRAETILVLGDVNPGAHVESEADILVWGRLRGIAHAGSTGDLNSIVAAMSMEPTQLRINDTIAIMPASDERRGLFGAKKRNPNLAPRPEVAYIVDSTIVVEPWDESKPGGIMAFRRS